MQMFFNYPEDDEYWNSLFDDAVLGPQSWIDVASELTKTLVYLRVPAIEFFKAASSSTVGQELPVEKSVHACYLMIAAYAIENLLKAIIATKAVAAGVVSSQSLLKELKTHHLPKLAAKAGVSLTDSGNELLARMTYFSVWAARYPAPLVATALKPQSLLGADSNTLGYFRGSDIRAIDDILNFCTEVLVVPSIVVNESCGYEGQLEDWEGIVMHSRVRPW